MSNILYNININQLALYQIAPNVSAEGAMLLSFMQQKSILTCYQKQTIREGDKLYFWFAHSEVFKQMPILFKGNETEAAISKKVRRLTSELEINGLIEKHTNPQSIKKSMYCFTEKTDSLTRFKESVSNDDTDKNGRVKSSHTDKSVQVTRTNLSKSKAIDTDKNGREGIIVLSSLELKHKENTILSSSENLTSETSSPKSISIALPLPESVPLPMPKIKKEKVNGESKSEKEQITKTIEFFNKKAGSNFKETTDSTRKLILKLIRKDYTGKDFADVINNRIDKWATDEKMSEYLRPCTIFVEKNFESYLNESRKVTPKSKTENAEQEQKEKEAILRKLRIQDREILNDKELILLMDSGDGLARAEYQLRLNRRKNANQNEYHNSAN